MYSLFNASNDILFYVVAARSTKVFLAQLTNGALLGAVVGGLLCSIYFIIKRWKK